MEIYVYNNRVYKDLYDLDAVLREEFSANVKNVHAVEVMVEDARFDGTYEVIENATEETIEQYKKEGYKVIKWE